MVAVHAGERLTSSIGLVDEGALLVVLSPLRSRAIDATASMVFFGDEHSRDLVRVLEEGVNKRR